ncbi:PH domain-containing protein [Haloarchaeobius sp. HRN-SO-5]|uniref:PH domain-containing protein n=1 Tax=Haloarchaeobius sp. HRN-SO-5 TaxID=3446118 RepID=UPI003EBE77D0
MRQRLHPITAVTRALQYGVNGFAIPFFLVLVGSTVLEGAGIVESAGTFIDVLFVASPLFGLLGAAYGFLTYLRFDYELTEDTFDLASGVLARTEREIPLGRIQNVDVSQNLLHRVFGVAVVRIETAGGGGTEAELSVVSLAEAERLQHDIRERRRRARTAESESGEPTGPDDDAAADEAVEVEPSRTGEATAGGTEPLFTISPVELFVVSLTRFQPGAIVLVIIGIPLATDLAVEFLLAAADPLGGPQSADITRATPDQLLVLVLVALPLTLIGSYLVSGVISALGYYDFRLARRGDDLVYERGLVQRYSGSIPRRKIQTLTMTETLLMRLIGYAALDVETAGYTGQRAEQGNQSAIPAASRERVVALASRLGEFSDPSFERPPRRARRRYAVRYAMVVAALTAVAYVVSTAVQGFTLWYLPAVLFLVVPVAAHLKWANRGYHLGEDHVVVRNGFWRRRTKVVPYYRLQTVVSEATVFQRRLSLATVVADTASSATLVRNTPAAFDLDTETAAALQRSLRERLQTHLQGERAGA